VQVEILLSAPSSIGGLAIDSKATIIYWIDDECGCIRVSQTNGFVVGTFGDTHGTGAPKPRLRNLVLRADKGYSLQLISGLAVFVDQPALRFKK